MKKHQKFLVGLMILGLAGGVGTAFALNLGNDATTTASKGADKAIYLQWSTDQDTQNSIATEVSGLQAGVAQYKCVVLTPKVSKTLEGTLTLNVTLSASSTDSSDTNKYALPGLKVNGYVASEYKAEKPADTKEKFTLATSGGGTTTSGTVEYEVKKNDDATAHTDYFYCVLEFIWDGTGVGENETFGGQLKLSQSFTEKTSATA